MSSFPSISENSSIPVSVSAFSAFGLHPDLLKGVEKLGFSTPTPIQVSSIPAALQGRDVLACAMTGSGKTAAFLLPIMHRILESWKAGVRPGVTRALILTPTRELAAQIREHLAELGRFTTIRGAAVFGGVGMNPQVSAFRTGVEVLVACPGRLLDHFSYPYGKLPNLDFLVIDEADRMLDMGFLPDIRRVLRHLPNKPRQTLFFSATMPEPIVILSRELLKNPIALNVERESAPADGVKQTAFPVPEDLKSALLLAILRHENVKNAIVFTRTKHRADRLSKFLTRNSIDCVALHSNRSQTQRTAAMADFKAGKIRILVATDIAARGIDVEALSHVFNFDVPHVADDYVHRVGRTARANRVGNAYTFVSPCEESDFRQIDRRSPERIKRVKLEGFDYNRTQEETLEIPLAQRIATIRAKKAEDRARSAAKAAARNSRAAGAANRPVSETRPQSRPNGNSNHLQQQHRSAENFRQRPGQNVSQRPRQDSGSPRPATNTQPRKPLPRNRPVPCFD